MVARSNSSRKYHPNDEVDGIAPFYIHLFAGLRISNPFIAGYNNSITVGIAEHNFGAFRQMVAPSINFTAPSALTFWVFSFNVTLKSDSISYKRLVVTDFIICIALTKYDTRDFDPPNPIGPFSDIFSIPLFWRWVHAAQSINREVSF